MTRVLAFGAFDVVHPGHHYFLNKARELGNELFVVVARDSTIRKVKGHGSKFKEDERLKHVQEISFVDKAVLGNKGDKFKVIEEINPDVIVLGYDQDSFTDKLGEELKNRKMKIKIVRLKAHKPEIYKSSLLKKE